ncbi:MAG TPA: hypothetical protein VK939_15000 [Longimicrobiales bacterium]|nr:hypothetical protein [Longimicrobiales bacterium]
MSTRNYRATLRYGGGQYHIADLAAASLRDALAQLVADFPDQAAEADLIEVRLQPEAERRTYGPG